MSESGLIVCGFSAVGKKHIVRQLNSLSDESPAKFSVSDSEVDPTIQEFDLHISNKYYTAEVKVFMISSLKPLRSFLSSDHAISAIVIVVDLSQGLDSAMEEIELWHSALSDIAERCDSSVLFGNYVTADSPHCILQESRSKMENALVEWSVDHSFEFIPNPSVFGATASASGDSFQSDDEIGVSRLRSALDCVRWPNLSMRSSLMRTPVALTPDEVTIERPPTQEDDIKVDVCDEKKSVEQVSDLAITDPISTFEEDTAPELESTQHTRSKEMTVSTVSSASDAPSIDQSAEEMTISFESLMDEMRQVRQLAVSGTLTDEQRRDNAARTMEKLISFMECME